MQKINMIEGQLRPMAIPEWVISEISQAPWEQCVSDNNHHLAFADIGMPISKTRSTLTPLLMAKALAELQPKSNDYVLEVGSSVMRLTTIFAKMCCGVLLLEQDKQRFQDDQTISQNLELRNVKCIANNDEQQKYSIVMLNYAVSTVPQALFDTMSDGGRLCAVVGDNSPQKMIIYKKTGTEITAKEFFETNLAVLSKNNSFVL